MRTKIDAAKIAIAAGCHMIIASGREPHPFTRLIGGERWTLFHSDADPKSAGKLWISGSLRPLGSFSVDRGARYALLSGKSLLPAGVYMMDGNFERGDPLQIEDPQGKVIGKGLSEYSSADARRILGAQTGINIAML